MRSIFKCLLVFCLMVTPLNAVEIDTFYGPVEIEEPILLELIESPSFQRLKLIHQYGVAYYTTHTEEYTRYDHCLGVFAILRKHHASLNEQIAGLLHDISHTVFSHVGDWIFEKQHHEHDYQSSIHRKFLEKYGVKGILAKYDLTTEQIMPYEALFPKLEQKGPTLCADRIEYNIQGAYHQGFISYAEALEAVEDLEFIDGDWVGHNVELITKLARFSLFMTRDCWSSPHNHFTSDWLAKSILRSVEIGLLTDEDIHYGTDQEVWDKLQATHDTAIQTWMEMLHTPELYVEEVEEAEAELMIKSKFRGIDPFLMIDGQKVRLTTIDPEYRKEFHTLKEKMEKGWTVRLLEPYHNILN